MVFVRALLGSDARGTLLYVVLSLASAITGSVAAILLVPVIQPGTSLPTVMGAGVFSGLSAALARIEIATLSFIVASIAFAVLRWWAARTAAGLVSRYALSTRSQAYGRLLRSPLSSLADTSSAEISNLLTYNTELMAQGFNALLQLLVAGVSCLISVGLALWMSPALTLAAMAGVALALLASRAYGRELSEISGRYVADVTLLFWLSEDFPRRLRHIRSFARESDEVARYLAASGKLSNGYRRQQELVASGRLVLELLAATGIAALFLLAHLWQFVSEATLIAVCLLLGRLLPYLISTRQSFQQVKTAIPAFALWRRFADMPEEASEAPPAGSGQAGFVLAIEKLRLKLPKGVLEVSDLLLRTGEVTLVSGVSGIGKSTLFDVISGMVAPMSLSANLDGRAIDFDEYRLFVRQGAYLSQGARPWQATVRDALCWAAPGAREEELWAALDTVGLGAMLRESREGLDTGLGNSSNQLSGGETQRLLLAQVILRRPRLALLDESTSALDEDAESEVLARVKRSLPGSVILLVSHRSVNPAIVDQRVNLRRNDGGGLDCSVIVHHRI